MATLDGAAYRRVYGPAAGDRLTLADTGLILEVESDDIPPGEEILGGCGKTWRDGVYDRSSESDLDLLVSNVVVVDPLVGIRKTCIGVKDGRIVGVGHAGSPDLTNGADLVVGPHTVLVPGEGLLATAGAIDSHVHLASPSPLDIALGSGITTIVGMGIGGVWDVGVNPRRNLHLLIESLGAWPLNYVLLARGSTVDRHAMEAAVDAGAGGFKVHEDYGASPACIDACLSVAEAADLAVALHTDSLNEFGMLEDTVSATAGRTVHAYHVEGGGGHPNLLEILEQDHIIGSSTTPTIPFSVHTVAELLPMTMTVHRQHADFDSDIETSRSRVHDAGIQAENYLHHLGAISIINSDALGMGRIGEMVRRTWQLAAHPRLKEPPTGGNDNHTILKFLAKVTINPAITHGISEHVGSLAPGRLADIVLWHPRWFGAKPELVIKSGFVAWGAKGMGNGSTRISQPRTLGAFFGGMGEAPRRLSAVFVSAHRDQGAKLPAGVQYLPVSQTNGLRRSDMILNSKVPDVAVPLDGSPVIVDGEAVRVAPLEWVPLGQSSFLA